MRQEELDDSFSFKQNERDINTKASCIFWLSKIRDPRHWDGLPLLSITVLVLPAGAVMPRHLRHQGKGASVPRLDAGIVSSPKSCASGAAPFDRLSESGSGRRAARCSQVPYRLHKKDAAIEMVPRLVNAH
jgi:hypothetical protein